MKIAILGAGGVGGYFGGRLAQAGHEVAFVARGKHLAAILSDGLVVQSIKGDFKVRPARATDRPEKVGCVDLVLCCVKAWQVEEAANAIRLMSGPDTLVIPLQNGVEAHATLAARLGADRVLPGLCRIISRIEAPGRIHHEGADPYLIFGEPDNRSSGRTTEIAAALNAAEGMTAEVSRDITAALWRKFMLITPWSGMGAITRSPIGIFRSLPETREMLLTSIREVLAVANALGVALDAKDLEATMAFMDSMPTQGTASMQRDIMAGRPSELHEQIGAVVRFGLKAGTPTPLHHFIYHSLRPLEDKARGKLSF